MLTWLKVNGPVIGALAGALLALVAVLQFLVAGPINGGFDDLRSEMSSRFEAVDRSFAAVDLRFDDLGSEMNSRFDAVDQRFEAADQRLNDFTSEMNHRLDAAGQRLDAVDERLGRLETGVSELRTLSDRVSRNEGQIDLLRDQLRSVDAPAP